MMRWVLGAMVGLCAGLGAFHLFKREAGPCTECVQIGPVPTLSEGTPPYRTSTPATLSGVVDVTDISAYLDPPEKAQTGIPFDDETTPPETAGSTVLPPDRIPPASEDLPASGISR